MVRVLATFLFLVLQFLDLGQSAAAAGGDCSSLQNDQIAPNQLYYQPFGSSKFKLAQEKIKRPDQKSDLHFMFVLFPHDRRYERNSAKGPTALLVKTQRYNSKPPYTENVLLFRNAFPDKRIYDDSVNRRTYTRYHKFALPDFRLTRFHAKYGEHDSVPTNGPRDKREAFEFRAPIAWNYDELRQSQLLYIRAVHPKGTCVPFFVGIDREVNRLVISITDLDPKPGGDFKPFQREFEFED